jgi:microcystin-dependent protein
MGGSETVSLLESEIPAHPHSLRADLVDLGDTNIVSATASLAQSNGGSLYQAASNTTLSAQAVSPAGGDQPHNNMMPYLTLNFCIALQGVYPPRT